MNLDSERWGLSGSFSFPSPARLIAQVAFDFVLGNEALGLTFNHRISNVGFTSKFCKNV